jgi:hypothetical protein
MFGIHGAVFELISLLVVCRGSFLSNFNADQLRIDQYIKNKDPVTQGVTLVKNHFVRNNMLGGNEWDRLLLNLSSYTDTNQVGSVHALIARTCAHILP